MNEQMLQQLLAGAYLCPIRYPQDYSVLDESALEREEVDAWLRGIGMRLARVGDGGAFFMTPEHYSDKVTTRIKAELRDFRETYGKAVRMLDLIRQTRAEDALCAPGERIQLVELETLVRASTTLSSQLRTLVDAVVIFNGNPLISERENLRRLLDHLAKDGYVMLVDKATDTYQVTGKIEQLYAALSFLDEHAVIGEEEAVEQLELTDEESFLDRQDADA